MDRGHQGQMGAGAGAPVRERMELLRADVETLAVDLGERNLRDATRLRRLLLARDFLLGRLEGAGCPVRVHRYEVDGRSVDNLEVEVPGSTRPRETLVVGAHYDSAQASPGANDNATGVAALVALATALMHGEPPARTVRLVAFATSEPPYARTLQMGSLVYARRLSERADLPRAMLNLDTLGSFARGRRWPDAHFPLDLYAPFPADFITVVGNLPSGALVRACVETFRRTQLEQAREETLPPVRCFGLSLPGVLPWVRSSDQWSFWQHGVPAVMVTDTAFFRSRHHHRPTDTVSRVDFAALSTVVDGLEEVVRSLAGEPPALP